MAKVDTNRIQEIIDFYNSPDKADWPDLERHLIIVWTIQDLIRAPRQKVPVVDTMRVVGAVHVFRRIYPKKTAEEIAVLVREHVKGSVRLADEDVDSLTRTIRRYCLEAEKHGGPDIEWIEERK